jgi:pilus assembly protein CpaB
MTPRRRRGVLMLCLALASGGLAASQVRERERGVEATVGPAVPVVVAERDISPDEPLRRDDLAVERVPARFVPPDALGSPGPLTGARTAVPVAAGAYLTAGLLQGGGAADEGPLRPGERALEVAVGGGGSLAGAAPGARVDVLVSVQRHEGAGRTFVALEDVQLLDLRPAAGGEGFAGADTPEAPAADALATLRVTPREAVYLTAAESFAHEVRLLVRPPGDRRSTGAVAVSEGEL